MRAVPRVFFYGAGAKIRIVGLRLHPKKGKKLKITLNSKNFKLNFFFSLAVFDKSRLNKIAKTKGFLRGVKKNKYQNNKNASFIY